MEQIDLAAIIDRNDLAAALEAIDQAKAATDTIIRRLRWTHGATWQQIGEQVGISRQAAWERWRHTDLDQIDAMAEHDKPH